MDIQFNIAELYMIAPMLCLFVASIIPLTLKVLRGNRELNPTATIGYATAGILSSLMLTFSMYSQNMEAVSLFRDALVVDGISIFAALITLIATFFALLFSRESVATQTNQFSEYVFLLLNSAIGMMILSWSNDLIVTFIGIEMMSLCLYLIIALSKEGRLSKESAFKYFVLGSFASAIFLYGLSFVFGTTGTTYIHEITEVAAQLISISRLFLVGVVLLIIGFCFKVAIAPFHAWAPDVYQGSPTPVAAFMATGVKVVTFVAFLRFISTEALVGDRADIVVDVLQWLAVLTILVGNIAAIAQANMKRMLAYSSIAHSGYVMVGLIAAGIGGQAYLGASGLIFYLMAYTVMTFGAFGVVSLFEKSENSQLVLDDLKGLGLKKPGFALLFSLFLLSLAGIPPTIGFFGKFYLFSAAIKQGLFWLSIWGVIGSVISVYYYLRPIVFMFMSEEEGELPKEGHFLTRFVIAFSAILVVFIGIFSSPFYTALSSSVKSLF